MVRRVKMDSENESINVKDIWATVTCPACKKAFNVQMKGQILRKNCRCSGGTFVFTVTPLRGYIDISIVYQYANNSVTDLEADSLEIDRKQ